MKYFVEMSTHNVFLMITTALFLVELAIGKQIILNLVVDSSQHMAEEQKSSLSRSMIIQTIKGLVLAGLFVVMWVNFDEIFGSFFSLFAYVVCYIGTIAVVAMFWLFFSGHKSKSEGFAIAIFTIPLFIPILSNVVMHFVYKTNLLCFDFIIGIAIVIICCWMFKGMFNKQNDKEEKKSDGEETLYEGIHDANTEEIDVSEEPEEKQEEPSEDATEN